MTSVNPTTAIAINTGTMQIRISVAPKIIVLAQAINKSVDLLF